MNTGAIILASVLFALGLMGTVLPVLPGAILIYGGMLLYGFMTGFSTLSVWFFIVQAILLIITYLIDYVASAFGTRKAGGSKYAAIGAAVATFPALLIFGPLGIVLGPLIGSVGIEMLRGIPLRQAWRIGIGTLLGTLGGALIKISIEIIMIIYFYIAAV